MKGEMLDRAPRSTGHGGHVGSLECSNADTSSAEPGLSMEVGDLYAATGVLPPEDPWLARRMDSFGASEVPALLIALGFEKPYPNTPRYVLELARRIFAVKAGIRRPAKAGQAAQLGNEAELPLIETWNARPVFGYPRPVIPAGVMPREFLPLLDRVERRLSCTPDGWARHFGDLVLVEVKTDQRGHRTEPTREWRLQVQTQLAVTGCSTAMLLYGPGWAGWGEARRGPIAPFVIERDEAVIERIREAAALGWLRVEALKSARVALDGKRKAELADRAEARGLPRWQAMEMRVADLRDWIAAEESGKAAEEKAT